KARRLVESGQQGFAPAQDRLPGTATERIPGRSPVRATRRVGATGATFSRIGRTRCVLCVTSEREMCDTTIAVTRAGPRNPRVLRPLCHPTIAAQEIPTETSLIPSRFRRLVSQ